MALSANTVWEVRTTGADTNGGGFVTGASGTDLSQSDSPTYSVTDGVTAGTTTITSATANFGTNVVGNIMYVQGGTGSVTAGWYQITARTNSTTITVDRSTGLTSGTGVTLKIGGALATIGQVATNASVAGMTIYAKSGTYSISSGVTFANSAFGTPGFVYGYSSTRGDNGRPTISTSSAITMVTTSTEGVNLANFIIDGGSTATIGILSSNASTLSNLWVKNCATGIDLENVSVLVGCEVSGCSTRGVLVNSHSRCARCYFHGNTATGVVCGASVAAVFTHCIFASNSGASSDGLDWTNNSAYILAANCVFFGNGRSGARSGNQSFKSRSTMFVNNIFASNGAYGVDQSSGGSSSVVLLGWSNNAYYNNTTAARNGMAAEAGAVTLTGDPFTNAAGGEFSLNNTAGAGAACRAAGVPGAVSGSSTTGYLDIGAAQHQDSGGSTVIIIDDE